MGDSGVCLNSSVVPVAINEGYVQLPVNNYTALIDAVANVGPVAISIAAGSVAWQVCSMDRNRILLWVS